MIKVSLATVTTRLELYAIESPKGSDYNLPMCNITLVKGGGRGNPRWCKTKTK